MKSARRPSRRALQVRHHQPMQLTICIDSPWESLLIKWDPSEEQEYTVSRVSPWEIELPDVPGPTEERLDDGGAHVIEIVVTHLESKRLIEGVKAISEKNIAEIFRQPVPIDDYPDYIQKIAYPIDISTIITRLESGYYRRLKVLPRKRLLMLKAVEYDMKLMLGNAARYNGKHSQITYFATVLFGLFTALLNSK